MIDPTDAARICARQLVRTEIPRYLYGTAAKPPVHRERPFAAPTRAVISPDGTRYESMSDAAKKNGLVRGQIYAAIRGHTHCRAGWRYA